MDDAATQLVSLTELSIPGLYFQLLKNRYTGTMDLGQVVPVPGRRKIWFRGGMPIFTDWVSPPDVLGEVLLARQVVNQTTLLSMLFNSLGVQPDEGAMARFPADVPYRLDVADPPPPLREPRVEPIEGSGLRVSRTFARHPRMAAARSGQSRYVNSVSPLTPYFRELLILRIGWNCQAVYEWAKHVGSVGRARDRGSSRSGLRAARTRGGMTSSRHISAPSTRSIVTGSFPTARGP